MVEKDNICLVRIIWRCDSQTKAVKGSALITIRSDPNVKAVHMHACVLNNSLLGRQDEAILVVPPIPGPLGM